MLKADRVLTVHMVFQGMDREAAQGIWNGFFAEIANSPEEYVFVSKPSFADFSARHLWDPEFLRAVPGATKHDDREGAAEGNLFWAGDGGQCGQVLHGYDSLWLPASLLDDGNLKKFADALYAAAVHWDVSLHFNKGLAGAPLSVIDAARNTATNPAMLDAFALAIIARSDRCQRSNSGSSGCLNRPDHIFTSSPRRLSSSGSVRARAPAAPES